MSMWDVLALAPTREVPEIKKAYAAKLRTTRPDDDALAYQQLRDAYQAALLYAKTPQPDPDPSPGEHGADSPLSCAVVEPRALVYGVLHRWKAGGDAALLAHWPQLKAVLVGTALAQAQDCSTAFAQAVLSQPKLPAEFIEFLREHFGWGVDFKRQPALSRSDTMAFDARIERLAFETKMINIEAEQKRKGQLASAERIAGAARQSQLATMTTYGHLKDFAAMMARASAGQCLRYAVLGGATLQREWHELSRTQRAQLEIDDLGFESAHAVFRKALRWRAALALAMVFLALGVQAFVGTGHVYAPFVLLALGGSYVLSVHDWPAWLRQRLLRKKAVAPGVVAVSDRQMKAAVFVFFLAAMYAWAGPGILPIGVALCAVWYLIIYGSLGKSVLEGDGLTLGVLVISGCLVFYKTPIIPVIFAVPSILLLVARKESAGFVFVSIACATIYQPGAEYLFGAWVGIVVFGAAGASALMRRLGKHRVTRFLVTE